MASEAQKDDQDLEAGGDAFVRGQLSSIDNDLMRDMPADARFESGVPEGQRAGALDFIQMTGLTRAPLRQPGPDPEPRAYPPPHALDESEPLSFYEAGVADVDENMGGGELESGLRDANLDANLIPDRGSDSLGPAESSSVQAFRDIIASLESGVPDTGDDGDAESTPEPDAEEALPEAELRSLADDLQADTAPAEPDDPPPPADDKADPDAATPPPQEHVEPPKAAAEEAAATDGDTDDFDALVASLESSGSGAQTEDSPEISEDWDALLDPAHRGEKSGREPEKEHAGARPLEQAGQLMSALGHRSPRADAAPSEPAVGDSSPGKELIPSYDYGAAPARRRSRRHSRIARRGWRLVKVAAILVVLACLAGALWYYTLQPWIEQPADLAAHAETLLSEGRHEDASMAFLKLSRRPSSNRPDAQFRAALVLTQGLAGQPKDEITSRLNSAKGIFETFIAENPQHPKAARALCIVGRLEYELGNYEDAITILRDQLEPEDDPAAALAMLRYLARSYVMVQAYDEAETAYLQAATLPGNYSAETDYRELGDMFRKRAGIPDVTPENLESYKNTAAAYWSRALQLPGIDPVSAKALQERLDWLEFTDKTGADMPNSDAAAMKPAPPLDDAAPGALAPPAISPVPAPGDGSDRVEDPGAAMEAVMPGAPMETTNAAETTAE